MCSGSVLLLGGENGVWRRSIHYWTLWRDNQDNIFLPLPLPGTSCLFRYRFRAFGLAPTVVGDMVPTPVKKAAVIHVRQMQHYDQEETDEAKEEPESWSLSAEERETLEKVKNECLTFERDSLKVSRVERHSIELIEEARVFKDRPCFQRSIRSSTMKWTRCWRWESLRKVRVRGATAPKPGNDRFCLDACKLNALTVKDVYPLPSVDGILFRIYQTHYISSADLQCAFWQIELDDKTKEYTAFTVPRRQLYQFRMMPFGLCIGAQRLVPLMDRVIPVELRSNVFVYLDDLLILPPNQRFALKQWDCCATTPASFVADVGPDARVTKLP